MKDNIFYKEFILQGLNPFVLFNNNGKLIEFNKEAEFLFNDVAPKTIYELCVENASQSFGVQHKYITLKYGKTNYYAILVGYIDDEYIGIELFKEVFSLLEVNKITNIEPVNIFSLLEISKSTILGSSNIKIEEIYDISIPKIKVNINDFLLTLNSCTELFKTSTYLQIKVNIKIGEYEIIAKKKHQIISIVFKSDTYKEVPKELETKAFKRHINLFSKDGLVKLEFPMILD